MKKFVLLFAFLLCAGTALARQTVISGRVVGHDGKPPRAAHVHLLQSGAREVSATVPVAKDGSYSIATDLAGMLLLQFTGADHVMQTCKLMVAEPHDIRVDAKLGTRTFGTAFDKVSVIGDFNEFSFQNPHPLKKNKNGTYSATFKTSAPRFAYQLLFIESETAAFSCNGTQSDAFEYDMAGDYRSILTPKKGSVTITFDPRKLPPSGIAGTVNVQDPISARLTAVLDAMDARRRKTQEALMQWRSAGAQGEFTPPDFSADEKSLREEIARESDPDARGALLIAYASLAYVGTKNLDTQVIRRALSEIRPTSGLWSIEPGILNTMTHLSGTPDAYEAYRAELVEKHPSEAVRLRELYFAISSLCEATDERSKATFERYYRMLQANYPDTREAMYTKAECDPARPIRMGAAIPAFSVTSLDDASKTISNESMRGQVYLIDFWATWCGPCVAEMKNLHDVFEKYHGKNFTIVSLSFDQSPEQIATFRSKKWPMPWQHVFVEDGFGSDLAQRFGVVGIPKPILVDGSGKIIATERDLRGAALEKTLARVLGGEMSQTR